MLQYTILLLIVPFLANCDETLNDGPCPDPPEAETNLNADQLDGTWRFIQTNYEWHEKYERECVELNAQKIGDEFYVKMHYKDSDSDDNILEHKYVPIAGQPGRYETYKKKPNGDYVNHGWVYTLVKVQGKILLEYACKEVGNQHKTFYRSKAKSLPIDQDAKDMLKAAYEETGDTRPMMDYKHENCNWKWD